MTRTSIGCVVLGLVAGLAACKGEQAAKPDPQMKEDLERCQKDKAEKDKLVKAVEGENARLLREKRTEITVTIEGTALTVKPGAPGENRPIDDKAAGEASKEFMTVFTRSRGAIQKCYEKALKNDTKLQARTITLSVSADFANTGQYKSGNFSPSLGEPFDTCMRTVASKWTLSNNPPVTTFKAQVSLTPS